jgi:hypothetical protein
MYDIVAGESALAHNEQLCAWLDGLEGVEARNTFAMHVSKEETIIEQYQRDPEDGKLMLKQVSDEGAETWHTEVKTEKTTHRTPNWLLDLCEGEPA